MADTYIAKNIRAFNDEDRNESNGYATPGAAASVKWKKGDCSSYFYTGFCAHPGNCSWTHDNCLPPHERKPKGKGKGKKGKGTGEGKGKVKAKANGRNVQQETTRMNMLMAVQVMIRKEKEKARGKTKAKARKEKPNGETLLK